VDAGCAARDRRGIALHPIRAERRLRETAPAPMQLTFRGQQTGAQERARALKRRRLAEFRMVQDEHVLDVVGMVQ
jgi:hypothetical protein